ncbi:Uncharacterized protein ABJ99_4828 [Pseudomonas syringae pv. cilantro]|uniref:Uncharacterized protein n=1 Tax=Pseudomonas syringae pv. cilantro TaxID=81035 RepID=A0A0N1JN94_PSESX|nr:Uncharacterized protein ABJ99_4828 [Pseudomonas syringae pv. cilantro]
MGKSLDLGYQAMAADTARENAAINWCNALSEDMRDASR